MQSRNETGTWSGFSLESWTWTEPGSQTCFCVWSMMEICDDSDCSCGYGCGSESDSAVREIWTWSGTGIESETCCCVGLSCCSGSSRRRSGPGLHIGNTDRWGQIAVGWGVRDPSWTCQWTSLHEHGNHTGSFHPCLSQHPLRLGRPQIPQRQSRAGSLPPIQSSVGRNN